MTKCHTGHSENRVNGYKYGFLHLSPRLLEGMKKFKYIKFISVITYYIIHKTYFYFVRHVDKNDVLKF